MCCTSCSKLTNIGRGEVKVYASSRPAPSEERNTKEVAKPSPCGTIVAAGRSNERKKKGKNVSNVRFEFIHM